MSSANKSQLISWSDKVPPSCHRGICSCELICVLVLNCWPASLGISGFLTLVFPLFIIRRCCFSCYSVEWKGLWQHCWKQWLLYSLNHNFRVSLEERKKNTNRFSQDRKSSSWDLQAWPPNYKTLVPAAPITEEQKFGSI